MVRELRTDRGLLGWVSPSLEEVGVPHLFSSADAGRALRVRPDDERPSGDADPALLAALASQLGRPRATVCTVTQVHGARVLAAELARVPADAPDAERPDADGLTCRTPGALVGVRTADCVPILLACRTGRVVAAVHAGWRGIVAGVVRAGVQALHEQGGVDPRAALGPCLSREAFEVGEDVAAEFERVGLGAAVIRRRSSRPHVDLARAVIRQLRDAGVVAIDAEAPCTYATGAAFSYRRDVTHGRHTRTGRLVAVIGPVREGERQAAGEASGAGR